MLKLKCACLRWQCCHGATLQLYCWSPAVYRPAGHHLRQMRWAASVPHCIMAGAFQDIEQLENEQVAWLGPIQRDSLSCFACMRKYSSQKMKRGSFPIINFLRCCSALCCRDGAKRSTGLGLPKMFLEDVQPLMCQELVNYN